MSLHRVLVTCALVASVLSLSCSKSTDSSNGGSGGGNVVINTVATGGFFPCWSPDGNWVIFSSREPCMTSNEDHDIMAVPAAGGTPQSLASTPDGTTSGYVYSSTSPTEAVAVFTRSFISSPIGGIQGADLYRVNLDGTGFVRLTTGNQYPSWPSYSPDGTRIAYLHSGNIYIMQSGGSATRFTNTSYKESGPLIWSPDGTKLVFLSDATGTFQQYMMPVIVDASPGQVAADGFVVDWERTGSKLWLVVKGGDGIYATNEGGAGAVRLVQDASVSSSTLAHWSPDGKKIVYGGPCAIKVAEGFR